MSELIELPTKQDLLNKATKCMIVNKEVAKTIESKTMTRRAANIREVDPYFVDNHKEEIIEKHGKYKVGDIAWLREPAKVESIYFGTMNIKYKFTSDNVIPENISIPERFIDMERTGEIIPNSELIKPRWINQLQGVPNGCIKEMARHFFEITDVRVERLQDITMKDIYKEGYVRNIEPYGLNFDKWFQDLWDSTSKKGIDDWDSNPYVFVYEYKQIKHKG